MERGLRKRSFERSKDKVDYYKIGIFEYEFEQDGTIQ
jgi:hypothetical protein